MPHNPAHLGISGSVTKPTFAVELKISKKAQTGHSLQTRRMAACGE